jgi:hypothetical protein
VFSVALTEGPAMFASRIATAETKPAAVRPIAQRISANGSRAWPSVGYAEQSDPAGVAARGATQGVGWSFSNLSVFPSDRAGQNSQPLLAAPALSLSVQPKLAIGAVNDPLEHEANRVAEQVMRTSNPKFGTARVEARLNRKMHNL